MHILLSNDDGYRAEGLQVLARRLRERYRVSIVAPERNCSGASHSLTLERGLRVTRYDDAAWYVDGTPTDCVHLALTGLLDDEPAMVVSGINAGANMGDDVLYSGTVAAAMEGRHLGLPALAVSLNSYQPAHFDTAAEVVMRLLGELADNAFASKTILNVNVPDIPWPALNGFRSTRLGNRHQSEGVIRQDDPRGDPMYWVGPPGAAQDAGEGTDFHAVEHNAVSVTPLHIDLTRHDSLPQVESLLAGL